MAPARSVNIFTGQKLNVMSPRFESLFADTPEHGFVLREDKAELASTQTPQSEAARREEHDVVEVALDQLPRRLRVIVTRHYGFNGKQESLAQIGRRYGVSKQRVAQWESAAIRQMRKTIYQSVGYEQHET